MKILVAIVHHWNPQAGGRHASLRADPEPRRRALQDQLLALGRMSHRQGVIDVGEMQVKNANQAIRHQFDLRLVTDGSNTVISHLDEPYRELIREEVCEPSSPMHLGFEAQKLLARHRDQDFDLLVYLEDDLLILDHYLFHKIISFAQSLGSDHLLLPHRMEMNYAPFMVDKLFIDGPVPEIEQRWLIPDPSPPLAIDSPAGRLFFESPKNPHSGCFVLTPEQMDRWCNHDCWQDGDCSFISPLESAATLGLTKVFKLYKPALTCASWLELQHWGTAFRSLIGGVIKPPVNELPEASC